MTTIFDIGSNNGDDIPYYLLKSEMVVAFEANPILCQSISNRFSAEIQNRRLIIENGILCAEKDVRGSEASFYIHKEFDVLSQFPKPDASQVDYFDKVEIPVRTLSDTLDKYGTPYYAKIDIEHYDHVILAEFFRLKSFPTYISAECHSGAVVSLLLNCPIYKGFKLVDGSKVHHEYYNKEVESVSGEKVQYSFPHHSAGPFGQDIFGPWYDRKSFSRKMLVERLGWKDMHASSKDVGNAIEVSVSLADRTEYAKNQIRPFLPESVRRYYRVIKKLS